MPSCAPSLNRPVKRFSVVFMMNEIKKPLYSAFLMTLVGCSAQARGGEGVDGSGGGTAATTSGGTTSGGTTSGGTTSGGTTSGGTTSGGTTSGGTTSGGTTSGGTTSGGTTSGGTTSGGTTSGGTTSGGTTSGGTTGSGGTTSGGTTGSGGTSSGNAVWASFDSELEGFSITFDDTTGGSNSASHDSSDGDPSNGSVRIEAMIAGPNEKVFFSGYPISALDLTGDTITARVRLDSGLSSDESCPGGAYIFAKSGEGYVFARGEWRNLSASEGWVTLEFNTGAPEYDEGFLPSDVREIGVAISSGGDCGSAPYGSAVAHIDSISF